MWRMSPGSSSRRKTPDLPDQRPRSDDTDRHKQSTDASRKGRQGKLQVVLLEDGERVDGKRVGEPRHRQGDGETHIAEALGKPDGLPFGPGPHVPPTAFKPVHDDARPLEALSDMEGNDAAGHLPKPAHEYDDADLWPIPQAQIERRGEHHLALPGKDERDQERVDQNDDEPWPPGGRLDRPTEGRDEPIEEDQPVDRHRDIVFIAPQWWGGKSRVFGGDGGSALVTDGVRQQPLLDPVHLVLDVSITSPVRRSIS